MSSEPLEGKWGVLGHQQAVALLENGLRNYRLSHAYLLVGPKHIGKMTLGVKLAQALNCDGDLPPCGDCGSCQRIAAGKHADVHVVSLHSEDTKNKVEVGIDRVREIQRIASLKPFEGRYRAVIIDEAERLSTEAANCLLKTLEEPPANVVILLLTANEAVLLPTVVSRCQKLELRPIGVGVLEHALAERWSLPPDKARMVARLSGGCVGWALSAIQDEGVLEERARQLATVVEIGEAGVVERFAFAARLAQQFSRSRASVRELLGLWVGLWRDLLLAKAGCMSLIVNLTQEEFIARSARVYTLAQIRECIQSLRSALYHLEKNVNPRLVFEMLLLSLPRGVPSDEI
ncbi:MAG: DNA polymerase III subunit [Chloroflexota bacterium]